MNADAWRDVRRDEIVPGDLVRHFAGDLVPADGHLLESRDLFVQEAALTSESIPVENVPVHFFHAPAPLFHTGWFVESLPTQTLVVFVIRTAGNPLRSRPSVWLTLNTLVIVAIGVVLPFSPLAGLLGFTRLPVPFFLFLVVSTLTYLLLVEAAKRRFLSQMVPRSANEKAAA